MQRNGAFVAILLLTVVLSVACSYAQTPQDLTEPEPENTSAHALSHTKDPSTPEPLFTPAPTTRPTPRPKSEIGKRLSAPVRPALMASDTDVCLNWLTLDGAAYYEIYYSLDGLTYEFLDEIASTAYLAQNLAPDTEYFFMVRAVTGKDKPGHFSPPSSIKTESAFACPDGQARTDLMLVAAHIDDELVFFGGILPYYTKYSNKKTALVFASDPGRARRNQERASLDELGLTEQEPEFLHITNNDQYMRMKTTKWLQRPDDELVLTMVRAIRKHRPLVIVTHDAVGEYGHLEHVLTAYIVTRALQKCADPNYDAESAHAHGAWKPKKVYLHLYPKDEIKLDYSLPLACYAGKTALEMAVAALKKHPNATPRWRPYYTGDKYDSSRFGLFYSSVGPDETADLFDHIRP